jgi:FKBP-type peptidyl-prolyl cis-trans isomerase FklB
MTKGRFLPLAGTLVAVLVAAACTNSGGGDEPRQGSVATESATAEQQPAGETVTTPSGLKYEVITPGTGKSPKLSDSVTVNYRGTLTNGTEFDSSYKRGKPATFPVSGVIKGWTEALQLMQEGAKWKLTIPPDLAYGSRGAGGVIGPNETLVFEVELLKVD